jgi:thioesterase domain-containing protein
VLGLYLYKNLAEELAADLPTYGISIEAETEFLKPELISKHKYLSQRSPLLQLPNTERLAQSYIDEIRKIQPHGPYQLMGSSFGGVVAFEIARQLKAAGEEIHTLVMLDSFAPGFRTPANLRGWASWLRREVERFLPRRMPDRFSDPSAWDKLRAQARSEAERSYRPDPYSGDGILIKARDAVEFPGYRIDQHLGWGRWFEGRLSIHEAPGDHLGILAQPNVCELAATLRKYLDREIWKTDAPK